MGSKKRPFYRIIATDSRNPRDGRFIETLGYYNPMTDPADVNIKEDLVFKWLERGAQPTVNTDRILRKVGVMKKWSLLKTGVPREELDAKYDDLKSKETPPMDPAERKKKADAKKAEAEAAASAEAETEAKPEAATEPAPEPAAEAETEAKPEAETDVKVQDAEAEAEPKSEEVAEAEDKPADESGDEEKKS
jgi:small subunit ribosomal protein S16